MKITDIRITRHRLDLDPPFCPSWDTRPRHGFTVTLVRISTDEGLSGIGASDSMVGFEGHEDLFLGRDPRDLDRHSRILANLSFHYGRCWPLEIALWDIAGKAAGLPCWRLLGGRTARLRPYASSGTMRAPEAMADAAERYAAEGYAALKIRFHRGDWRDDIKTLEAVRKRMGGRIELMVDCNQGWRMPWDIADPWTLKDALPVARELERLGAYWMEEPLHRGDRRGMAELRRRSDLRIAGGEMTRELHEFRDLIEDRALDVLQPDAALTGGITGLRRIAAMAQEAGVGFTPHTWSHGLGLLGNLHLCGGVGGVPFVEFPYDPPEWTPERRDFLLGEPTRVAKDGWITLSEKPGLGVELDEKFAEKTRVA